MRGKSVEPLLLEKVNEQSWDVRKRREGMARVEVMFGREEKEWHEYTGV